ncbi:pupal cuticle protein-like [Uranotaenia lowii]|uniref:pupal cuticle protein-like n=1 Tax=Uranotaenia lowii TaxID=190385 RepID=UPI00247B2810|nr:pupal cuticle protein-like [Uranotaenia lowii]
MLSLHQKTKTGLVILVLLAALNLVHGQQQVEVLDRDQNINPDGSYAYRYRLSDGTEAQEQGQGGVVATGGYRYYSPEGELIEVSYTADENGFQPQGDHIPQPPPIPDAIIRALEYIRTHARPT